MVAIPPMRMFCCQPMERRSRLQTPHHSKTSKWLHIYDQKQGTYNYSTLVTSKDLEMNLVLLMNCCGTTRV